MRLKSQVQLTLCKLGWRLNSTISPSMICLSTISPMLKPSAMAFRFPNLRNFLLLSLATKLAPGCTSGPFLTAYLSMSTLCDVTRSGYVNTFATRSGTATSSMRRFGSGEMTVRPEKSTRFPERLPRNRPCLPFRRWTKPRMGFWPGWDGTPGSSELMYIATES